MSVKISHKLNLDGVIDKFKKEQSKLRVGFFDEENASKAFWNEYGVPENNIPPRPFMDQTFEKHNKEWLSIFKKLLIKFDYHVDRAFANLGEIVKNDIQKTIQDGNFKENAPSTIKRKGGRDTPLLDTHDMFHGVQYEVVTDKE